MIFPYLPRKEKQIDVKTFLDRDWNLMKLKTSVEQRQVERFSVVGQKTLCRQKDFLQFDQLCQLVLWVENQNLREVKRICGYPSNPY
jgi:hypothetical protein